MSILSIYLRSNNRNFNMKTLIKCKESLDGCILLNKSIYNIQFNMYNEIYLGKNYLFTVGKAGIFITCMYKLKL
jgi:hypothetical protein